MVLTKWLNPVWIASIWRHLRGFMLLYPALGMIILFFGAAAAWGAFNWSLELTNTEKICVSCHCNLALPPAGDGWDKD